MWIQMQGNSKTQDLKASEWQTDRQKNFRKMLGVPSYILSFAVSIGFGLYFMNFEKFKKPMITRRDKATKVLTWLFELQVLEEQQFLI